MAWLHRELWHFKVKKEMTSWLVLVFIYLFLLNKSYSKYKKKIQQLYKNKRTQITYGKM